MALEDMPSMPHWHSLADTFDDVDRTEWEVEILIDRLKGNGVTGMAALKRLQRRIQDALLEDREDLVG